MEQQDGCGCLGILLIGLAAWLIAIGTGGSFLPILIALGIMYIISN